MRTFPDCTALKIRRENGHVDLVAIRPLNQWATFRATVEVMSWRLV